MQFTFDFVLLTLALAYASGSTTVSAFPAVGLSPTIRSEHGTFQARNVGIEIARAPQHVAINETYIPLNISTIAIPAKGWFTDQYTKTSLWARVRQPSPKRRQKWINSVSEAQSNKVLMKKYHPYQGAAARHGNFAILTQNNELWQAALKDPKHELYQTAQKVDSYFEKLKNEPLPLYSGLSPLGPPPPYPEANSPSSGIHHVETVGRH